MKKTEIEVGGLYDLRDSQLNWNAQRCEVLSLKNSGDWNVRLLDPPYTGHQRTVSSRQIANRWISPASRMRNDKLDSYLAEDCIEHHQQLLGLACDLAEKIEACQPDHPVDITSVGLPSNLASRGAPGSVGLTLSEPAAQALLEILESRSSVSPALAELLS